MSSILDVFLYRTCCVQIAGVTVCGTLLCYESHEGKPHRPSLLVLLCPQGKMIVRGEWSCIFTKENVVRIREALARGAVQVLNGEY